MLLSKLCHIIFINLKKKLVQIVFTIVILITNKHVCFFFTALEVYGVICSKVK